MTDLIATATAPDAMAAFWTKHSGEVVIVVLAILVFAALLIVVPQLLKAQQRSQELLHAEHMRSLENGDSLPPYDVRSRAAGRAISLVPMVSVIAAATVTCFLVAYPNQGNSLFSVSVVVWAVAGIVSLAAITGGVALLGRLAQIEGGWPEDAAESDAPNPP